MLDRAWGCIHAMTRAGIAIREGKAGLATTTHRPRPPPPQFLERINLIVLASLLRVGRVGACIHYHYNDATKPPEMLCHGHATGTETTVA